MYSAFENFKLEFFGESHSEEIGFVLKGLPSKIAVSKAEIQKFVDRRKSGANAWSTPRKEDDIVVLDSGIENGFTTGESIIGHIKNTSQRKGDYDKLKDTPRPSHADYVAKVKFGNDVALSGGGKFSGRMTAPMCAAGAIAKQILEKMGVKIGAYVLQIGKIRAKSYDDQEISYGEIEKAQNLTIATLGGEEKVIEFTQEVLSAKQDGDSVGGMIECMVFGLEAGYGNALYDGLEGRIAASVFAIPAVKSVEFGAGAKLAEMRGSQANDSFYYCDNKVMTKTNNSGGINGGISNGMNVTLRVGFRPTPSISKPQETVNLATGENTIIEISGRHDACIVPRAVAVVEAAVGLAILDCVLSEKA